ncbi:MAG: ROK family protein [Streptosporangiales bacterium]
MSRAVIAVDVGGSTIKGAIVGRPELTAAAMPGGPALASTAVRAELRRPVPVSAGPQAAIAAVRDVVCELCDLAAQHGGTAAAALALPGIVDETAGVAVHSENVGWRDVPFRRLLAEWTRLPTVIGHDVRAGGLAESRIGAARGFSDVAFVPIGTGIAAALTIGGRVHSGGGLAGEIGHVDVGHDGLCACGKRGCLEAIASAAAIARRYAQERGENVGEAAEVAARMAAGDPVAERVWQEAIDALGLATAWLASVLAPEAIIIGGGLSQAGPALFDPLRQAMEQRLSFQRRPRLAPAALGDRAGFLGAALLAEAMFDRAS